MADDHSSRRTGPILLGGVGVVLVGAVLVNAGLTDPEPRAPDDATDAVAGAVPADEGEVPGAAEDTASDGAAEDGPAALDDGRADLPSFVDQAALTRCAAAAGPDLVDFPDSTDDVVQSTTSQVSELRDLEVVSPVEATFLTSDELRARVTDEVDAAYPAAQADVDRRLLSALGVVDADVDLRALLTDLQAEQVAGFYDPNTAELVVVQSSEGAVSGLDKITLAHEITHALADQRFELSLDELPGGADAEQARLAVIEGDATLTMTLWSTRGLSIAEQLALATTSSIGAAAAELSDVPRYLVGSLTFPYEAGLNLVCAAYEDGGWDAVDALYDDPPETTAQVLDLDLWRDDVQPLEVPLPPVPSEGWSAAHDDTIGRLDLQLLFEAPGDDVARALPRPGEAAAAWRGGRVVVWRPDDTVDARDVVDVVVEGAGLCATMSSWLDATWETAVFSTGADETVETVAAGRTITRSCDGSTVSVRITSPNDS